MTISLFKIFGIDANKAHILEVKKKVLECDWGDYKFSNSLKYVIKSHATTSTSNLVVSTDQGNVIKI